MLFFSTPRDRENWLILVGGETTLKRLESHVAGIPATREQQDVIKRFFVKEPRGRSVLLDHLEHHPHSVIKVKSYELLPPHDIPGIPIFTSYNYIIKEDTGFRDRGNEILLIEQNTCMISLTY